MLGGHKLELPSMPAASHHSVRALRRGLVFSLSSLPRPRPPPFHRKVAVFHGGALLPALPNPRLSVCSAPGTRYRERLEVEELRDFEVRPAFEVDAELRPPLTELELKVRELEELPDQWRRSRLAWLCKELPAHKPGAVIRVLNGQRKWMDQEGATYVVVHCMRIRENDTSFRVCLFCFSLLAFYLFVLIPLGYNV